MPIKISDLDPSNSITEYDLIQIIDVEDTINMGASGTNKKITAGLAANQFANLLTSIPTIIQTELNTKADEVNPSFSGNVILPVGTSIGPVTSAQIGYLNGVTGPIQTQLDGKISAVNSAFTGTATFSNSVAQSLTEGALHCNATAGAILMDDGGHKRISWNDGTGNFNIRAGHYTKTGDIEVYAKSPSDLNSGGATKIVFATDASNGNITLSAAAIGTPGNAVTWGNNFVLNKDSAHTDKKFGIGTSTPDATLHINSGALGATLNTEVEICRLSTTNGNASNLIVSTKRNAAGTDWTTASTRIRQRTDVTDQGYIEFNPSGVTHGLALGSGSTAAIIIKSDGKVGIGKSNPATALDVNGTVTATSFSGAFSGSFTGNAATSTLATKASTLSAGGADGTAMTFTWTAGSGAQPAWLWGGNSSDSITLWNPSNFSVNYATSAGSAGTATTAGNGAKAYGAAYWSGTGNTNPTARFQWMQSHNIASVTWMEAGVYKLTFTNAMANNRYGVVGNINLPIDITSATYAADNWYDGLGSNTRDSMTGNENTLLFTNKETTHFYVVIHSNESNLQENTNGFSFIVI